MNAQWTYFGTLKKEIFLLKVKEKKIEFEILKI